MTDSPLSNPGTFPDKRPSAARADAVTSPIVELRDVRLKLGSASGEVNILNGVSLTLRAGETVGVVGRSGSGKTSTLMVAAGLEAVTGGDIRVCGHDLKGMSEDALALLRRDNIGVVFQGFHLIPTMTALENVAVPLELAGIAKATERAKRCLQDVGLDHRAAHYPGQLSGGEQQRVALARAFAPEPKLLLADEPTGNLDGPTGGKIMDMIFAMVADRGVTMMLVTHDPTLAARCDRVVQMENGRFITAEAAGDAR